MDLTPSVGSATLGGMSDPYRPLLERAMRASRELPGALAPTVRQRIEADLDAPDGLAAFVHQIMHDASSVTREDIDALLDQGFSEDEIFEAALMAALGAGRHRLDIGLRVAGLD